MQNKLAYRIVAIPRPLWKLHGRRALWLDVCLTYVVAVAVAVTSLLLSASQPLWAMLLLAVLSLDIGGGVVSNFTGGTIAYYRASALSPYVFVWVHMVQGAVLAGIYWEWKLEVVALVILAMLFASLVIRLRHSGFRRQLGVLLFVLLSLAVVAVPELPRLAILLLTLLGLKLIMGFAGNQASRVKEA